MASQAQISISTIGHSTHSIEDFIGIRRDRVVAQSQIRRPDEKEYHGGHETAEGYSASDDLAPAAPGVKTR